MSTPINFVQGFQGEIPYTLNFDGQLIDTSDSLVTLIFVDKMEQRRHSITCKAGKNDVIIPIFKKDSGDYGEFYGQFVIKHTDGNSEIYPMSGYISIKIQKGL